MNNDARLPAEPTVGGKKARSRKNIPKGAGMKSAAITKPPAAYAAMLIRKPVSEVFEAIIDPEITSHFWFTHGSGRLAVGKPVQWDWEMHGVSNEVNAKKIEPNQLIVMEWPGYSGPTTVTWKFREVADGTFLEVEETGWTGSGDELVKFVCNSTGGFTLTLAGMKAYLEHDLELNLVADRFPEGIERE
jgi:uncharacterized protein YndB with AHSA1/START domain